MNRNLLFLLLIIFLFSNCQDDDISTIEDDGVITTPPTETSTPNILLIIADDVGLDATQGYDIGDTKPNMPRLAALATDGLTFENAWAMPVCAPTRSSIISGRYGYRTGVLNAESASQLPTSETTIQAYLDVNTSTTYSHSVFGKWHLSGNNASGPTTAGVGTFAGILGGGIGDYFSWPFTENGETNQIAEYTTTKITDLAIDWIQEQSNPWFCWVAYNAAHTPFHLPPADLHYQDDLPDDDASVAANPRPYYLSMVESLDTEMGRLFDNIPPDELNNTIIIFIGDNGTPGQVVQAPYTQNRAKGSLYQGGVHVPLVVAGNGVSRKGEREYSLINSTDLFATIAEIAGLDLQEYEDSQSFKSLLTAPNSGLRNYNYAEVLVDGNDSKTGYTIRNERYKLIQFDNGTRRMYDLQEDPYEGINLLNGGLTAEESVALENLEMELLNIRN